MRIVSWSNNTWRSSRILCPGRIHTYLFSDCSCPRSTISINFYCCSLGGGVAVPLLLNTSSLFSICQFFLWKIENTEFVCESRTNQLYFFLLATLVVVAVVGCMLVVVASESFDGQAGVRDVREGVSLVVVFI